MEAGEVVVSMWRLGPWSLGALEPSERRAPAFITRETRRSRLSILTPPEPM
jgi:hypothetical protein